MGIKATFKPEDIERRMTAFQRVVERRVIERMQYLGEECTTIARSILPQFGFMDRTGNLRSSIGYMVFVNGQAVRSSYSVVKNGSDGAAQGEALARKIGAKYRKGVALVVTAGMNYAAAVEAKGRDVLTSAELYAEQQAPKIIKKLKDNINKSLQA
jgi:hypothetical protein